ncbi:response regulator transcription factor [Actinomadura keratinilytica]
MPAATDEPPTPHPVRLLLCDDHAVVRASLRALLSSAPGIEVVAEAGSGEEALALTTLHHPDLVLMDLQLGEGIDGVETTRRLTTLPDHPRTSSSSPPTTPTPTSPEPSKRAPPATC